MFQDNSVVFKFRGLLGVEVHVGSTILFLLLIFVGFSSNSTSAMIYGLSTFAIIIISIYLHELGHAWGCKVQGIGVDRILLYGGGGLCFPSRAGSRREQELIVIMGPLVNLAIWAISGIAAHYLLQSMYAGIDQTNPTPEMFDRFSQMGQVYEILTRIAYINLFLFGMNMIPIQPLDGGKLFHLGLLRFLPGNTALRIAGGVGMVFTVLWFPALIAMYFMLGWVLLFFPSWRLHYEMFTSGSRRR